MIDPTNANNFRLHILSYVDDNIILCTLEPTKEQVANAHIEDMALVSSADEYDDKLAEHNRQNNTTKIW